MIEIIEKTKCSGCTACYSICPARAITMNCDNEGFLYPSVDMNKCIHCGKCNRICPYNNRVERKSDLKCTIAAYNKNESERCISSSGGIFFILARTVLNHGGIVFGAAYDNDFMVYHTYASNQDELLSLVGSKYMQSKMGDTFSLIKKYLDMNTSVLFIGTSCQCAGLRAYLMKDYNNLICVDFICLGVPSPKVWKDYINSFFKDEQIKYVNFKDKSLGWHQFSLKIKTNKQVFCRNGRDTFFFTGYFKNLYSRPSCSKCIFKCGNRDSDITISDCWGYHHIAPEMDDNKGLSSIVIHSDVGMKLFESVKEGLCWKEAVFEDILTYNSNYSKSAPINPKRKAFWDEYETIEKRTLFEKYCSKEKETIITRIINRLRSAKKY